MILAVNDTKDFEIISDLISNPSFSLQRVRHISSGDLLLLKRFYRQQPQQIKALKLAAGLVQEMKWKTVLLPQKFIESEDSLSIFYTNSQGYSVRTFIDSYKKLRASEFIPVATGLASMVSSFHETGWIIKNLHPDNILITEHGYECILIDAQKATNTFKNEIKLSSTPAISDLFYISPEQSGMLNRITDRRSDYYSLGVIFYELLTGTLPFVHADPLSLLHAHVTLSPPAPSAVNPLIPASLSNVILKLLEKNAEDRYQSISGLIFDLAQSVDQNLIQPFILGTKDNTGRITVTDKLIGRSKELNILKDVFVSAVAGNKQVMYIRGHSGVGKTRLVSELQRSRLSKNQKMVTAKFDVLLKHIPYSALKNALKELIKDLLKEDEIRLVYWKTRLIDFMNDNGKIITDVFPELKIIVGQQPEVKALPPEEAQNRFNQTVISFIRAFATDENFFCIFLDDLQWADIASIKLIELIVLDSSVKNFLFIGAYRDNEVDFTHPLSISRKKQEQWIAVKDIYVNSLALDATAELVSISLQNRVSNAADLTALIYKKSQGNTFYVLQLLVALYESGSILLNKEGFWEWDNKALQLHDMNQDVAELLSKKITGLSHTLQEVLKCASCLGDTFDLKTIAHLVDHQMNVVAKELSEVINIGYLISLDDNFELFLKTGTQVPDEALDNLENTRFKFAHDRIRQATLTLVEPYEQARLNLKAGKFKLAFLNAEELLDEVFYLANYFNAGEALIKSGEDIMKLVDVNLKAGIKAKNTTAYEAAINYFESGKKYLNFNEHYDMLYIFSLENAICKFLSAKYEDAERDLDFLIEKANSRFDKLNALLQKVYLYNVQNLIVKAVDTGRLGFQLYGVNMPKKKAAILSLLLVDLLKARFLLRPKQIDSLLDRALIKDKEMERFLEFILSVAPSLYQYDQNLFAWNTMKMVLYSLKYGNNGIASFGFIGYGMIISQLFKNYKTGKKLADIALELNNRLAYTSLKWKVLLSYYNFVHHWTEPLRPSLDVILEVENGAHANGDPIYAGYAIFIYHQKKFALGFSLRDLQISFEEYLKLTVQRQDIETNHFLRGYYQAVLCLNGSENNTLLMGENFDAPKTLMAHIDTYSYSVAADTFIPYMSTLYLFGHAQEAYKQYVQSISYMPFIQTRYDFAEFNFYGALICARACELQLAPFAHLLKQIKEHVKNLELWKNNCPENFEPQYLLALAELERVRGGSTDVTALYERAIASAGKYLFINYKAMACELAGRSGFISGNQMMAKTYLVNARAYYLQWGAYAKVRYLEEEYGSLLGKSILGEEDKGNAGFSSQNLDLTLLLQTAKTVTSGKDVDALVKQLMQTIIQYAGADCGYLLIENRSDLIVKARYNPSNGVTILKELPEGNMLPLSIIRYVSRLKEPLIVSNPAQNPDYQDLVYFKHKQPKSLLCYPVLKQGSLFGIIYIENQLNDDAFSEDRVNTLHLISSQIAMQLDNAYLYENLEVMIKERTSEIETKMDISDGLLRNILPGEAIAELKATGKTTAQKFDLVSVLMADIKGFTLIAEKLTPEELIGKIDLYFRAFDEIMIRHGVEKIKTIGDAYMAVGGFGKDPVKGAVALIGAAIDMQDFMRRQAEKNPEQALTLRIGLHTGTVIAGVVGTQKLQYDIWGDTVNVAARMEQNSEPGRVNVSKTTTELAGNAFTFIYRGEIDAKNKGKLDMFFVENNNNVATDFNKKPD